MNRWKKVLGYTLGGALVLVLIGASGVYGFSEARYRKQYTVKPSTLVIPTDSAARAHGDHLVHAIAACVDCHGENMAGSMVIDQPIIGRVYAPNVTTGKGGVGRLSDADYIRAIRHGVAPNGTPLKVMPASDYINLSDDDLASIIAYVKALPPVDHETPPITVGPLGRALFLAGQLPIIHAERIDHDKRVAPVAAGPTAEYGAYLAGFSCKGCHGPGLAGGHIIDGPPDWPLAANLTPAGPAKDWTEEDFKRVLREGKRPDGSPVNEVMPWKLMKRMSDDEIRAVVLYIKTMPAQQTPGVSRAN